MDRFERVETSIALSMANLWDALAAITADGELRGILERHQGFDIELGEYLAKKFQQ